ncbi:MAG: class I SAM-dependent methyltransferase [Nostocoides sp.]
MDSRAAQWNERYAGSEQLWSPGPNTLVADLVTPLSAGRAVDLGAGEGRHAIWLAQRGWSVHAVDFAEVGIQRGRQSLARIESEHDVAGSVSWAVEDAVTWSPEESVDLVLIAFLHVPQDVISRAGTWLRPGGRLLVVGHALRNLTEGVGGPSDPALLHTPQSLNQAAISGGLTVQRCGEVLRETEHGTAIDVVLLAQSP